MTQNMYTKVDEHFNDPLSGFVFTYLFGFEMCCL